MSLRNEDVKRNGEKTRRPADVRGEAEDPSWTVMSIMESPVWTLQASDTLGKASNVLSTAKARHSPILKGDRLVGLLCSCDMHFFLSPVVQEALIGRDRKALDRIRIQEVVGDTPVSIGPYHSVLAAAQILLERGICALPVVKEQRVLGLVSQEDVLRALVDRVRLLEAALARAEEKTTPVE